MTPRARSSLLPLCLALAACPRPGPWGIGRADPRAVRTIAEGEIVGGEGRYGSQAWLGIPYAAPPVGPLRWRAPRPPPRWRGRRETLAFGPQCPQIVNPMLGARGPEGAVAGDEDCLTLNVWTPPYTPATVPAGQDELPVMVFIHGGSNSIGTASNYDGGHLAAARGVMIVTVQYRLGPLGWFRHRSLRADSRDAAEASGNFGTLDLVRALEWIRRNATAFGGDPGNVTVFGESAGGLDTFSLLVSPLSKGLFRRAIVESGGLAHSSIDEAEAYDDEQKGDARNGSGEVLLRLLLADGRAHDRAEGKALVARMGDAATAAYLRAKTPAEILHACGRPFFGMLDIPLVFGDGAVLPAGPWLPRLGEHDGWNRVPVIVGTNRDEVKLFFFFDKRRIWKLFGLLPRFADEPAYEAASAWLSRAWKAAGADAPAEAMRSSGVPVYVYRFDWRGEPTVLGADLGKMIGAAHGMELPFVFGHFDPGPLSSFLFPASTEPARDDLSSAIMGYWTEFARTGAPGRGGANYPDWTAWEPTPQGLKTMLLDVPVHGGLAMSRTSESLAAVVAGLAGDGRLAPITKCRALRTLAAGVQVATSEIATAGKRLDCARFRLPARLLGDLDPP